MLVYVPRADVSCGLAEVESVAEEVTLACLYGHGADLLHLVDSAGIESYA